MTNANKYAKHGFRCVPHVFKSSPMSALLLICIGNAVAFGKITVYFRDVSGTIGLYCMQHSCSFIPFPISYFERLVYQVIAPCPLLKPVPMFRGRYDSSVYFRSHAARKSAPYIKRKSRAIDKFTNKQIMKGYHWADP